MKTKITVSIDSKLWNEAKDYADNHYMRYSGLIEKALTEEIKEKRK